MKNLLKVILVAIISTCVGACNRDEVTIPTIDVTTDREVYEVNDTVEFRFSGTADMITFYSGENGQEYKHRNRLELEGGELLVGMETQVLYGLQENNLRLFMSTDFSGEYTKTGVEGATWTDISDRLTWCVAAPGAVGVRTVSDFANVSDLVEPGKPVYFAFRYIGTASTTGSAQQRTWRIYNFDVKNQFSETEIIPVTDRASAGWTSVTIDNEGGKGVWFLTNATMIYYNPESNLLDVEKWVVTKRFDPNKVAPDNGIAIKKYPDDELLHYTHSFSEPGEYEVTFVFTNANYNGVHDLVKTVKVRVE